MFAEKRVKRKKKNCCSGRSWKLCKHFRSGSSVTSARAHTHTHTFTERVCYIRVSTRGGSPGSFTGAEDKAPSIRVKMASVTDSRHQPSQKDAADQNFDYMFKILIIGNSSVGKTSFLFRYADDSFTSAFVSTVGIDFKVKTVFRNNKRIKLQIWDTAGQERYRTITTAYYRGAMGFLLMYDITNQDSFNAVQDWATQIKTYSWDNAQVILVGNKCDLEDDRLIPTEDSQRLARELGFQFFEASAKDNINVKQVFECLVDVICEKMNESMEGDGQVSNHKDSSPQDTSSEGHSGCVC
ncbi:ras-related protein Rab-3D-like isoform X1 [Cyprinus carpio]|uniref:Ras-related protein Rab-3 n=2 Tax=Cyprinus carpio TaxID=7962 RepID=A0A8C1QF38_CYPCA|nr:ras-related protein Rab-3D-like isoform X1 [Cyprinus carpio]